MKKIGQLIFMGMAAVVLFAMIIIVVLVGAVAVPIPLSIYLYHKRKCQVLRFKRAETRL